MVYRTSEVAQRLGVSMARVRQLQLEGRLATLGRKRCGPYRGYLFTATAVLKLERQLKRWKRLNPTWRGV